MKFKWNTLLVVLVALAGCGPSEKDKAMYAEQQRLHCLDNLCDGDVLPKLQDHLKEITLKLNGQWFIGPREYVGAGRVVSFDWWDHKPISSRMARPAELQALSVAGKGYDVSIEIFLQTQKAPLPPLSGYDRLKQAEAEGRLISKEKPRSGLEIWRVKPKDGLRPGIWYVATDLKGFDGQPPVVWCDEHNSQFDRCSTGGLWRDGVTWDTRFRAKHGPDWPEIFQETTRVLQLIKKA